MQDHPEAPDNASGNAGTHHGNRQLMGGCSQRDDDHRRLHALDEDPLEARHEGDGIEGPVSGSAVAQPSYRTIEGDCLIAVRTETRGSRHRFAQPVQTDDQQGKADEQMEQLQRYLGGKRGPEDGHD